LVRNPGIFAYPLLIAQGFAAEPSTPPYLFATPAYANYATVLGFDLRDERGPVVTIVINHSVGGDNASIDLALPIKIKQSSPSEEALFRIGAFERWTLVTYTDERATPWPQQVSFYPVSDIMPDPPPQNTELRGSFYFQIQGQFWRFLYRYPDPNRPDMLPSNFFRIPFRPFDAIAVALPEDAKRVEVRGKSEMPEHLTENRYARFYPPRPVSLGEPFLEIEYLLPTTRWQNQVVKYFGKAIQALVPLLGALLAYVYSQRTRLRITFIGMTVAAYVGLFVWLISFASRMGETGSDAIGEYVLLGASAIVSLITFLFKRAEEGAPKTPQSAPKPPPPPASIGAPSESRPRVPRGTEIAGDELPRVQAQLASTLSSPNGPTAESPRPSSPVMRRTDIFNLMLRCNGTQLTAITTSLGLNPAFLPDDAQPIAERASEILRLVEQREISEKLEEALLEFFPRESKSRNS